jgi:hypothetical protein
VLPFGIFSPKKKVAPYAITISRIAMVMRIYNESKEDDKSRRRDEIVNIKTLVLLESN